MSEDDPLHRESRSLATEVILIVKVKDSPLPSKEYFRQGDHRCTPETNIILNVNWNRKLFLKRKIFSNRTNSAAKWEDIGKDTPCQANQN